MQFVCLDYTDIIPSEGERLKDHLNLLIAVL